MKIEQKPDGTAPATTPFYRLVASLAPFGRRLLTTWPCVIDASYLLNTPNQFEMLRWIEPRGATVCPFGAEHLGDKFDWMSTCTEQHKREMYLADASLYRQVS